MLLLFFLVLSSLLSFFTSFTFPPVGGGGPLLEAATSSRGEHVKEAQWTGAVNPFAPVKPDLLSSASPFLIPCPTSSRDRQRRIDQRVGMLFSLIQEKLYFSSSSSLEVESSGMVPSETFLSYEKEATPRVDPHQLQEKPGQRSDTPLPSALNTNHTREEDKSSYRAVQRRWQPIIGRASRHAANRKENISKNVEEKKEEDGMWRRGGRGEHTACLRFGVRCSIEFLDLLEDEVWMALEDEREDLSSSLTTPRTAMHTNTRTTTSPHATTTTTTTINTNTTNTMNHNNAIKTIIIHFSPSSSPEEEQGNNTTVPAGFYSHRGTWKGETHAPPPLSPPFSPRRPTADNWTRWDTFCQEEKDHPATRAWKKGIIEIPNNEEEEEKRAMSAAAEEVKKEEAVGQRQRVEALLSVLRSLLHHRRPSSSSFFSSFFQRSPSSPPSVLDLVEELQHHDATGRRLFTEVRRSTFEEVYENMSSILLFHQVLERVHEQRQRVLTPHRAPSSPPPEKTEKEREEEIIHSITTSEGWKGSRSHEKRKNDTERKDPTLFSISTQHLSSSVDYSPPRFHHDLLSSPASSSPFFFCSTLHMCVRSNAVDTFPFSSASWKTSTPASSHYKRKTSAVIPASSSWRETKGGGAGEAMSLGCGASANDLLFSFPFRSVADTSTTSSSSSSLSTVYLPSFSTTSPVVFRWWTMLMCGLLKGATWCMVVVRTFTHMATCGRAVAVLLVIWGCKGSLFGSTEQEEEEEEHEWEDWIKWMRTWEKRESTQTSPHEDTTDDDEDDEEEEEEDEIKGGGAMPRHQIVTRNLKYHEEDDEDEAISPLGPPCRYRGGGGGTSLSRYHKRWARHGKGSSSLFFSSTKMKKRHLGGSEGRGEAEPPHVARLFFLQVMHLRREQQQVFVLLRVALLLHTTMLLWVAFLLFRFLWKESILKELVDISVRWEWPTTSTQHTPPSSNTEWQGHSLLSSSSDHSTRSNPLRWEVEGNTRGRRSGEEDPAPVTTTVIADENVRELPSETSWRSVSKRSVDTPWWGWEGVPQEFPSAAVNVRSSTSRVEDEGTRLAKVDLDTRSGGEGWGGSRDIAFFPMVLRLFFLCWGRLSSVKGMSGTLLLLLLSEWRLLHRYVQQVEQLRGEEALKLRPALQHVLLEGRTTSNINHNNNNNENEKH